MQTSPSPTQSQVKPKSFSAFKQLEAVIFVAFLLATLFTAWTPSSFTQGINAPKLSLLQFANQTEEPLAVTSGRTATPRPRPLVGIVVGHWGDNNDPGSVCDDNQLTELMVNQNVANVVKNSLIAQGVDVILLKEFDQQLIGFKANLLVSIHADSCQYINDQAKGFKVAAALSNPHPELSARLTACLRARYAQVTKMNLHSTSITDDMTSYHAFSEIDENTPAAIIETGFLNLDRDLLQNHPEVPGKGITEGILCYLRNEDISPSTPQPTP